MRDDPAPTILGALRRAGWPRTVADVAATTGLERVTVRKALGRLAEEGAVQRVAPGLYRLPTS